MENQLNLTRLRRFGAVLSACLALLLTACLGLPTGRSLRAVPTQVASFMSRIEPAHTPTAFVPLVATKTPETQATAAPQATEPARLAGAPDALAGFPFPPDAEVDPDGIDTNLNGAKMLLYTASGPAELDHFYKAALIARGWTLRYADGNPAGGFLQEWKNGQDYLTVEYGFKQDRPGVSLDVRTIDTNKALALLLGFPLPNGTEVTRQVGSSIELFVPQDFNHTEQFFLDQLRSRPLLLRDMPVKALCGLRDCPTPVTGELNPAVHLMPIPTPDYRQGKGYRVILPDQTQMEITLLPHHSDTIVMVFVNWKNLVRFRLPVGQYAQATITAVTPASVMFETQDPLKDVAAFYEQGLAKLGWGKYMLMVNTPEKYSRMWVKNNESITLSLVRKGRMTYGTMTCKGCQ